jgi:hypothetical protein
VDRLYQLEFRDSLRGIAKGGQLWSTSDAGNSWEWQKDAILDSIRNLTLLPDGRLFGCKLQATSVSSNFGKSWTDFPTEFRPIKASFSSTRSGWLIADTNTTSSSAYRYYFLLSTTDLGKTWRKLLDVRDSGFYSIENVRFADSLHGAVSVNGGSGGLMITSDGGESWKRFADLFWRSPLIGFIPFSDGKIIAMNSGGDLFTYTPPPMQTNGVTKMQMAPAQSLICVSPNPANQTVKVNINGAVPRDAWLTLHDISGRLLRRYDVRGTQITLSELDAMPSGRYQVIYHTPEQSQVAASTFILQH